MTEYVERDDDDRPWLVSFPRTGSNWLRTALSVYLGYHPLIHAHNTEWARGKEVVYLWREDATAVVYSMLRYRGASPTTAGISKIARAYAEHLSYWLRPGRAAKVVTYEQMEADLGAVVADLLRFCCIAEPESPFCASDYDHALVAERSAVDQRVVVLDREEYEIDREKFRLRNARLVEATMRGRMR